MTVIKSLVMGGLFLLYLHEPGVRLDIHRMSIFNCLLGMGPLSTFVVHWFYSFLISHCPPSKHRSENYIEIEKK